MLSLLPEKELTFRVVWVHCPLCRLLAVELRKGRSGTFHTGACPGLPSMPRVMVLKNEDVLQNGGCPTANSLTTSRQKTGLCSNGPSDPKDGLQVVDFPSSTRLLWHNGVHTCTLNQLQLPRNRQCSSAVNRVPVCAWLIPTAHLQGPGRCLSSVGTTT